MTMDLPTVSEGKETWIEGWPFAGTGLVVQFALFLQQRLDIEAVDIALRGERRYLFHVAVSPSRVLQTLLELPGLVPAEIRASASGHIDVIFPDGDVSEPGAIRSVPTNEANAPRSLSELGANTDFERMLSLPVHGGTAIPSGASAPVHAVFRTTSDGRDNGLAGQQGRSSAGATSCQAAVIGAGANRRGWHDASRTPTRETWLADPLTIAGGIDQLAPEEKKRLHQSSRAVPDRATGPGRNTEETGILEWSEFLIVAGEMARQGRESAQPLAIVIATIHDSSTDAFAGGLGLDFAAQETISGIILKQAGNTTVVGRHGGRSFTILVQNINRDDAWIFAEGIRQAVERYTAALDVPVSLTISLGVSTLPHAGVTVAELVDRAGAAAIEAIANGGNMTVLCREGAMVIDEHGRPVRVSGLPPAPVIDPEESAARRRGTLLLVQQKYERAECDGVALRVGRDPCLVCAEAAQHIYVPQWAPRLPIAGCTALDGCRCLYSLPPVDVRRRPPPVPSDDFDQIDIPLALREAALFGARPKGRCSAEDLAQYLDAYPMLPYETDLKLNPGEVIYLTRSSQMGFEVPENLGAGVEPGLRYPLNQHYLPWARLLKKKPPSFPKRALSRKTDAVVHLTNWRIILENDARGTDSFLLAGVADVELYREGIAFRIDGRAERLIFLVRDPLHVGLYFARALRDIANAGAE